MTTTQDKIVHDPIALKYYKVWRKEVTKNDETEATSESRLIQIRFLLVEQAQMQRELDGYRKQLGII